MSVTEFSFQVEKMAGRINDGEPWQVVIQAHLYLDHVITATLIDALVRPDAIEPRKLAFSQKLDLVHAMGLLPSPMIHAIRYVNTLRNSIAHRLDFEVTPAEREKLRSVCPPMVRQILEESLEKKSPFALFEYLKGFVVIADMHRQHNAFRRIMERRARLNARKVLNMTA